ncbi:hypothetical protein PSHT_16052 [Puccinia striiformis]|uniref:Uncharacterized protein n=1 Tax=Puccinia striiformis TaxID=27350 RepID=A0A2S4UBT8_9BASI|nr:hypothetical protein PSHT_16052 [Puccinia striiformis]
MVLIQSIYLGMKKSRNYGQLWCHQWGVECEEDHGGHMVPGQFQALYKVIEDFENGPVANKESVRKAKGRRVRRKKAEEDALAERRGFWTK